MRPPRLPRPRHLVLQRTYLWRSEVTTFAVLDGKPLSLDETGRVCEILEMAPAGVAGHILTGRLRWLRSYL